MKRSRKLVFAVPASALLAAAGWLLWSGRAPAAPAPSPEAPAASGREIGSAGRLASVQAQVAEKNREAAKDREAFIADGWEMVAVPPPDHRVVNFDPKLLEGGREHELKMQLLSTVPSPEQARRVAEIARRA